ncbi:hypothetical protein BSLG_009997 [Batrachochytrium salamandrivorans]|nr:hypothetical protein BASA62_007324 [Batrachochytrium salamandrivorans]KAJ1328766.1 hypothetical protein BSLG_009997 [Batrachochytrium salamandrivorans]
MIFPALLILLVSFCQGAPNPPTESNPDQPPDGPMTASFICPESTVVFTTDPKKVPPLLLSGLCNAAKKTVGKLTSASKRVFKKYQREKTACKTARARELHLEMMVDEAYQDTMESKEGSFDARLDYRLSLRAQLQDAIDLAEMTCSRARKLRIKLTECVGKCRDYRKDAGAKAGVIIDEMLNLEEVVRLGNGIDDVTASSLIDQAKKRFEKILHDYKSPH